MSIAAAGQGLIWINESPRAPGACTAMKRDTLWFVLSLAWLAFLAIAMPVVLLWH
jgi:hypothetical protein